jgi:predicted O-methyltransferase YrrM
MKSKAESAFRILQREGPKHLAEEIAVELLQDRKIGDQILYELSLRQIQNEIKNNTKLDEILDTVFEVEPGYGKYKVQITQLRDEIRMLAELARDQRPKTVLEIGTSDGGTFYIWCQHLSSANQLVSLDLPDGRFGGGYDAQKVSLYDQFNTKTELDFIRKNSHNNSTLDEVQHLVNSVDFLFIDGDHTYEGVRKDFEMYKKLVSDGGIIAFHDIVEHPKTEEEVMKRRHETDIEDRHIWWTPNHPDCGVDKLWEELSTEYKTTEIISHEKQTWGGIGVVHL